MREWDRIYVDVPTRFTKYVFGRRHVENILPKDHSSLNYGEIETLRGYIESALRDVCGSNCYVEFDFEIIGKEGR